MIIVRRWVLKIKLWPDINHPRISKVRAVPSNTMRIL
jgi:hypothetical protein